MSGATRAPAPLPDRVARSLAEGWQVVSGRLLAGLCHSLNDRVSTLTGLAHLAHDETGLDRAELTAVLGRESSRLHELARLLARLAQPAAPAPEPVDTAPLLQELIRLHGYHRGLERVRVETIGHAQAPPILAEPTGFSRSVLVLLAVASRATVMAGADTLTLEVAEREGIVEIALRPGSGGSPGGLEEFSGDVVEPLEAEVIEAFAAHLAPAGGEIETEGGRLALRVPTLAAARRPNGI